MGAQIFRLALMCYGKFACKITPLKIKLNMIMKLNINPLYMLLAIVLSAFILSVPNTYLEPDFQTEYRKYYETTWEQAGDKGLNPKQAAELERRSSQFRESLQNQNINTHVGKLFNWMIVAHIIVMLVMYVFCRFLRLKNKCEVLIYSIALAVVIVYSSGVVSAFLISLVFIVTSLRQVISVKE